MEDCVFPLDAKDEIISAALKRRVLYTTSLVNALGSKADVLHSCMDVLHFGFEIHDLKLMDIQTACQVR